MAKKDIEEKMAHLVGKAMKTYLDVLEKGKPKPTAESVALNLAVITFDSIVEFYGADVKRRKEVMEEFIGCASGPPRGIFVIKV